jgi:hypothetical protein
MERGWIGGEGRGRGVSAVPKNPNTTTSKPAMTMTMTMTMKPNNNHNNLPQHPNQHSTPNKISQGKQQQVAASTPTHIAGNSSRSRIRPNKLCFSASKPCRCVSISEHSRAESSMARSNWCLREAVVSALMRSRCCREREPVAHAGNKDRAHGQHTRHAQMNDTQ